MNKESLRAHRYQCKLKKKVPLTPQRGNENQGKKRSPTKSVRQQEIECRFCRKIFTTTNTLLAHRQACKERQNISQDHSRDKEPLRKPQKEQSKKILKDHQQRKQEDVPRKPEKEDNQS
jgi:hypothetical protein